MSDPIPVPLVDASEPSGLGRREVLQRIAGAVGAAMTFPGLAAGHPMHAHLSQPAVVGAADAKAKAAKFRPEFLDEHQYATLTSLAERIVPGSTKARVSPFLDALLAVDSMSSQRGFLQALGAFDGHAIARFSKPWKALTAAQQTELLDEVSTMASGREARTGARGVAEPDPQPARLSMRDHFETLKGWISGAYYSSELGMRDLGFTGNVFYAEFPGCKHDGGHL